MSDFKKSLGQKIKSLRNSQNLTQEHMAELVGIEQASLSNIERGKFHPNIDTFLKIAKVLGVEPYELYMFNALKTKEEMINTLNNAMSKDENLTKLMYKFYQALH